MKTIIIFLLITALGCSRSNKYQPFGENYVGYEGKIFVRIINNDSVITKRATQFDTIKSVDKSIYFLAEQTTISTAKKNRQIPIITKVIDWRLYSIKTSDNILSLVPNKKYIIAKTNDGEADFCRDTNGNIIVIAYRLNYETIAPSKRKNISEIKNKIFTEGSEFIKKIIPMINDVRKERDVTINDWTLF